MNSNSVPNILLVDDDPLILKSLKEILNGRNYLTSFAASGSEAIDFLGKNKFDLCILDLIMPGVSGRDVMGYIRARKLDTDIVVLSGDTDIDAAISALSHRASAFIRKPFSPEEFLKTVDKVLKKKLLIRQKAALNEKIKSSEKLYRFLSNHSPDFIYLLNTSGEFIYVNDRVESLLGYSRGELLGKHYSHIIFEGDLGIARHTFNERRTGDRATCNLHIRLKRKNSVLQNGGGVQVVHVELNSVGIYSYHEIGTRSQQGSLGVARELRRAGVQDSEIKFAAYHDVLTGLPNRSLLHDRLSVALDNAKRHGHLLVVMFIDLDGFKEINDSMGHAWGDRVLQIVTDRLKERLRKADTLARYGGDEFILMLPQVDSPDQVEIIAKKVLDTIKKPIINNGKNVFVSASIGISAFPRDGDTEESLIQRADAAMYKVKRQQKDGYHFFSMAESLSLKAAEYQESELADALASNQFVVFYQPLLEIDSDRVVGFEALLRWHHPDKGLLFPSEFLQDARKSGLMPRVDDWVFRQVLSDYIEILGNPSRGIKLFLNLSAEKFLSSDFCEWLESILSSKPVFAENLFIEVPSTAFQSQERGLGEKLASARKLGTKVVIDIDTIDGVDRIPFHEFGVYGLKIASGNFKNNSEPERSRELQTLSSLAKSKGLVLIAKNLESRSALYKYRSMDFDMIQGFLFHHPLPVQVVKSLL